jgi:hypothetical protein
VPAAQVTHVDARAYDWYEPAAHAEQLLSPCTPAYVPALQLAHAPAEEAPVEFKKVPAAHAVHVLRLVTDA